MNRLKRLFAMWMMLCIATAIGWSAPVFAANDGLHVDYHSQEDIRKYFEESDSYLGVPHSYSIEPIRNTRRGQLTYDSELNALGTINTMRYIAGLNEVELDTDYEGYAQAAAFVNYSIGMMTHTPELDSSQPIGMSDTDWDDGCFGARNSNLAMGHGHINAACIDWLKDSDSCNVGGVGHRRWILNPSMGWTGFGAADMFYAMYVTDKSGSGHQYNVAWPAANMPVEFFDADTAWSLSPGRNLEKENIIVTLTRVSDGREWVFDGMNDYSVEDECYMNVEGPGCGQDGGCIIFRPDIEGYNVGDEFEVEIVGVTEQDIKYSVKFFDLFHRLDHVDAKQPTTKEEGNIEYWHCDNCDKYYSDSAGTNEITKEETVLAKLEPGTGECPDGNHTWESGYTVDKEATCTETGIESIHCIDCGAIKSGSEREITKAPHTYAVDDSQDPTCTESGYITRVCSVCGDTVTEEIPAAGHEFGDWEEVEPSDCEHEGLEQRECKVCGDTETRALERLAHEWECVENTPATCKQAGSKVYECKACGETKTETIPKLTAHSFAGWVTTKAATEIATGQKTRTCKVCGHVEKATVAMLKPTLPAVTIKAPKAAKKAATIKWTKFSKAKQKKIGYFQIQYSTDKKFRTGVKTVTAKKTAASKKITKLTSKKVYYVRVRAYLKSGGKVHVSKWSTVKSVKAK